ncbi:MAG: polyketide synthase dehydratase domain-containing protein [Deltaproteobacteria bacterium]|nr:polyketide synthase dehydratase domain-containing protein [Deltaproteobacteria bacterium]
MANLSQIKSPKRFPLEIAHHSYLMDHRFDGNAVFPAVEAMQLLAASTQSHFPEIKPQYISNAKFEKFLYLHEARPEIEIFNEISAGEKGILVSKLTTRTKSKTLSISRLKEHVSLSFHTRWNDEINMPPVETLTDLESKTFCIPAEKVYNELVPFGPSYHNIKGDLFLSEKGAIATIHAPKNHASTEPLGSPFPLDAAFHAACAWCQCFLKFIGFPVGFKKRHVIHKTHPGREYTARMIPVKAAPDNLICDLWIWSTDGRFFEAVSGLVMRDVSGGRKLPPKWIMNIHSHKKG